MSSLPYVQQLSKVIVAQITQTIGWNSIQTTPLELLTDILHKYLEEITRQTQRYTELCKHTNEFDSNYSNQTTTYWFLFDI